VVLEGTELLVPVGLQLVEPGLERQHRLGTEPEHPSAGVLGQSLVGDDPGVQQDPEVPTHRGGRRAEGVGELAGAARPLTEQLDDLAPDSVSEGLEECVDGLDMVNHIEMIITEVNSCPD
jgi:hypothetical protein